MNSLVAKPCVPSFPPSLKGFERIPAISQQNTPVTRDKVWLRALLKLTHWAPKSHGNRRRASKNEPDCMGQERGHAVASSESWFQTYISLSTLGF